MNPVPKFIKDQVVWELGYDINLDKMADARLGVVKEVEWVDDRGWMATVKFPDWPTRAVELDSQVQRLVIRRGSKREGSAIESLTDTKTAHEDSFRALTPPEYRAP